MNSIFGIVYKIYVSVFINSILTEETSKTVKILNFS